MKNIFLVMSIFLIAFPLKHVLAQETDSLHIYIIGEFKSNDDYQLRYKRNIVCEFGSHNKVVDTCIVYNTSNLEPYDFMEFDIYKKNRFGSSYSFCQALVYYPELQYVEIYFLPYISKDLMIYYFPYKKRLHIIDNNNKI